MDKRTLSSPLQIFLVSFFAMTLAMATLGYATYQACYNLLEDNLGKRAVSTAQIAVNLVELDKEVVNEMLRLDISKSRKHPQALAFKQKMGPLISHNDIEYIYVEVKLPANEVRHFVEPKEENIFGAPAGTPMQIFYLLTSENESSYTEHDRFDVSDHLREKAYAEKRPIYDGFFESKWGNLMTGYAPIYAGDQFIGFLGVDISSDIFIKSMGHIRDIIIASFGILVLLGGVFLYRVAHFLSMPLFKDGLTELFNHKYMKDRLIEEINRSRRYKRSLAILMLDLDFFKRINDEYGHQAGDQVLKKVSDLVRVGLREEDIACRYGGEELLIILPETGLKEAISVAERLRCSIENTSFLIPGITNPVQVTASLGIAELTDEDTPTTLLEKADQALYLAKSSGRNRYHLSD